MERLATTSFHLILSPEVPFLVGATFFILLLAMEAKLLESMLQVTLECNGPSVKLTVGGHVYTAVQPNHRFAGKLLVYAGNTYEQNANAEINGFEYEILPATKAKADVALLSDMQVQTPKDETSILHRENEDN
eukprot:Em0020g1118a